MTNEIIKQSKLFANIYLENCYNSPCMNGGTCNSIERSNDNILGYTCDCRNGYHGENCTGNKSWTLLYLSCDKSNIFI